MKQNLLGTFLLIAAIAATCPLQAQLNVFSDGSDGVLDVTPASRQIDLALAVPGIWNANNSTNTGKGIWDPNKRAIVFKYSSINIPANRTITFKNHPNRPPVVWLVQGNVTIAGAVSLSGAANTGTYLLAEPGPGGFRGGAFPSGAGLGPGGGNGATGYNTSFIGRFSTNYGNAQIIPLIGGSGAGSNAGNFAAGGGGGAILIALGGDFVLNGTISANGASGASDGAVRIIADSISGTGTIDLRDDGRLRLEANSVSGSLITIPQTIAVAPASPPKLWPDDDAPQCRIIRVDGQNTPLNPTAPLDLAADIGLDANAGQVVTIQTNKFPINGTVELRVAGKFNPVATKITATFQAGDENQATWTATVPFASGFTTLQARAFVPNTTP